MRILPKLFVLLMSGSQVVLAQHTTFTLPETGQVIRVSLERVPGRSDSFNSVDVISAEKHFHLAATHNVARIPATPEERRTEGFWTDIPGLTLHPSRYFLVSKYGTATNAHTLLFFVGQAGGSDAAPVLVIGFSETGSPYKVLEREYLDVISFQSAADGTALIVGKDTLSQVMGGEGGNGSTKPYATTYDHSRFSSFTLETRQTIRWKNLAATTKSTMYGQVRALEQTTPSFTTFQVIIDSSVHRLRKRKLFSEGRNN